MKRGSLSGSSSSPSYLRHKALTRFLKNDSSAIRRARSVQSFLASSSSLDQRLFFLDLHPSAFKCCQDALAAVDAAADSADSVLPLLDDVQCVFSILAALIEQVPQLLRSRWQLAPLITILQQALGHHHVYALRAQALTVLLKLIDILHPSTEPVLLTLLSSAVNLLPFLPPSPPSPAFHSYLTHVALQQRPTQFQWAVQRRPASSSEQQVTEVRLLDQLLAFSTGVEGVSSFSAWWGLYQAEVLPLLYPALWDVSGMTGLRGGKGDGIGFPSPPPPLLHQSVIAWLQSALPLNVDELLPSLPALEKLLALLRLTFLLPPSSAASQLSVLSLYAQWLRGEGLSPLMRGQMQAVVMAMVDHVTIPLLFREEMDIVTPSLAASSPSLYAEDDDDGELTVGRLSFQDRERVRKGGGGEGGRAHAGQREGVRLPLLPPLPLHPAAVPRRLPAPPLHAADHRQHRPPLPLARRAPCCRRCCPACSRPSCRRPRRCPASCGSGCRRR